MDGVKHEIDRVNYKIDGGIHVKYTVILVTEKKECLWDLDILY